MEPVEAFRNNDLAYRNWLGHHPDGFVLDCYRHRPQSYMMLHHAACEKINKPESLSQPEEFTGQQYFKVCSLNKEALVAWAYQWRDEQYPDACVHCAIVMPSGVKAPTVPRLPKHSTRSKSNWDWWTVGAVALILIAIFSVIGSHLSTSRPGPDAQRIAPGPDAQRIAQRLLEEWKRGEVGAEYWKDNLPLQSLYAVRDYEHVASGGWKRKDGTWEPSTAWHRFRIKSSTKGGFPIEKLWDINLEQSGLGWKVTRVTEVQQPMRGHTV